MDPFSKTFAGLLAQIPPLSAILILVLVAAVISLWNALRNCEKERNADSRAMVKVMMEVAETQRNVARSIDQRNQITDDLSKSIDNVAVSLQLQGQTIAHHHERLLGILNNKGAT